MNGYERIKAALEGRWPDKVPVMLHNFMMASHEAGYTMEEFRNDPEKIAESFIRSVEKYRFDGILVDIDTVTLAGAAGVPVDFPVNEPARAMGMCLHNLEDVKALKPCNIENYRYIQVWLEAVRLLKDHFKDEIFIRGNCDQAPFSLASMMRGTQNWMIDLMMADESLITMLLEYCTAISNQFIKLMSQTGCDMISNGDSPAGPSMISAEMYEQYALPYEKMLVETAHSLKLPYALHICGDTGVILDKMIASGADAFELDYKTDSVLVFELLHDKAVLIGNIDPSGVLALGLWNDVSKATGALLDVYRDSPRFILNAGCAIPPITPAENIHAMIKTARDYR